MAKVELRNVVKDTDRHGNDRWYYRVPGQKKIRLRGEPGSDEFNSALAAAREGRRDGLQRVPQGSLEWLCNQYFNSLDFKAKLAPESQKGRRNILRNVCKKVGTLPYSKLERRHVLKWMDDRADRPEAANNLLKALRGLFRFAVARELVRQYPLEGLHKIESKSEGFHTWTVDEIRQFEAAHAVGTMPRLVLALALFTGLRRGDLVRIGSQHIDAEGRLVVRNGKTLAHVQLPVLPPLKAILDATPRMGMQFVTNEKGRPYTAASLGNMFRRWAKAAKLPGCTLHGLRKAGATIAANNGATDQQLMAIFGWTKADMATLYTRQRDSRKLAGDGMYFIDLGPESEQEKSHPADQWDNASKKESKNNVA